jgi:hypothetical protein
MGRVRRTVNLVLALALMTAGFGLLSYLLLAAPGWKGWMVLGSGFAGTLGALWLYDDFIKATPNAAEQQSASRRTDQVRKPDMTRWDTSAATMASIRDTIQPIQTDKALCEVLTNDFPRDCSNLPIAGGWGYVQADAIIMVRDEFSSPQAARDFVALEYHIAQKIIYEELIIFRPKDFRFSGIEMKISKQGLRSSEDGSRRYDVLDFAVTCWSDWHWEQLKQEWEENDFGEHPNFSKEAHAGKRSASRIVYERKLWFDITDVFELKQCS